MSFLHDLNYGYQLLKMVRDIDSSQERVKRVVNDVAEEFHVQHNDEGEPSGLDLLTIEMNSNRQQTNTDIIHR